MDNAFEPLFSIVIPCKNEAADIAKTLDACLNIDYLNKEIIVVDDSTDETPDIVTEYTNRGVRLIYRVKNSNGCCGARNLGMQEANEVILVLVNADDRPQPDFLNQILYHYQQGADFVIVRSKVLNLELKWGRYTYSVELMNIARKIFIPWSEGFSCRKTAAKEIGYIPGDFPVPFCRDWMFGAALEKAGYKKRIDLNIVMEHLWPSTIKTYLRNQIHRGTHSSPSAHYFRNMSIKYLLLRETSKAGKSFLFYLLIIPAIWRSIEISQYSPKRWKDIPSFFLWDL